MTITAAAVVDGLERAGKTAEAVGKVAKLLKQGAELYLEITGVPMESQSQAAGAATGAVQAPLDRFVQEAGQQWAHLPSEARYGLLSAARAAAGGDQARLLASVFSQLRLLVGMAGPAAQLGVLLGSIVQNQVAMLKELEKINGRLAAIEARLDEQVLVNARKGVRHLVDAANADVERVREDELRAAGDVFAGLIDLDPKGTTQGTSGGAPNKVLITLGYWGRHLSFGMRGDTRLALRQAYECTQLYPLEGILIFPPAYFSRDYKAAIDAAKLESARALERLAQAEARNRNTQLERGLRMAGGALTVVGSVVAAIVLRQPGLVHLGGRAGAEAFESGQKLSPNIHHTLRLAGEAQHLDNRLTQLRASVVAECGVRRQELEKITAADLRQMMVGPQAARAERAVPAAPAVPARPAAPVTPREARTEVRSARKSTRKTQTKAGGSKLEAGKRTQKSGRPKAGGGGRKKTAGPDGEKESKATGRKSDPG